MENLVPDLSPELKFRAVRSGGKGGQNVNKVSSKVEVRFHLFDSQILSDRQKEQIAKYLKNRINAEGELVLACDTERTQLANKRRVLLRLNTLLEAALKPRKNRIATKPGKAAREKRLQHKKIQSQKKENRKNIRE